MDPTGPGGLTLQRMPAAATEEHADAVLAASGDGQAFERLYRSHAARIHSLARRMTSEDHADDLTQEVFLRAWQKLDTFRGEAAFGTWLHRLAVNVILGRRQVIGTERKRLADDAAALDDVAAPGGGSGEWSIDFEEAIARLPDGARQVFLLHDVYGYRHEEIAAQLGIVPGTSKSQLHHARMALRKYLDR